MKLGIMQPYFLPYIGYFQLINAVDKFVILDDVNYINRGWINRNRFLVNGKMQLFTVPLIEASQNKLICEIDIVEDLKWKEKLLKTIAFSYKKALYYKEVYPLLETIILHEENNLSKYIYNSLLKICGYIGIHTDFEETSMKYKNGHLKAENKIIDICVQEGVDMYINPIGGTELYNKQYFIENKFQLNFIQSNTIEYRQFDTEFVPGLSIIDVLMFNSIDEINTMLTNYKLI